MILEDLICTNTMQRGVGNVNAIKMCKCIMEMERIYGIRNGGDRKSDLNNSNLITQLDLAEQLQIDKSQLINYKKLNDLIPKLQSLIENNSMKATVWYKLIPVIIKEDLIDEDEKLKKLLATNFGRLKSDPVKQGRVFGEYEKLCGECR